MKFGRSRRVLPVALAAGITFPLITQAQSERDYIMRSGPYPVFSNPEPSRYNLKIRNISARIKASAQAEFNDNLTLSENNQESDFSFGADAEIGFLWPLTKQNVIQLDVGFGYRWYLDHPSVSTLLVAPNSRFDYRIYFDDVQVNIHDVLTIQNDPTSRADISGAGTGSDVLNFRRLNNAAGLVAEYRPVKELGLQAGYDYIIDRSMGSTFEQLDRDSHSFNAQVTYNLSPRWTAGISGYYTMTDYLLPKQNDATSYGGGPMLTYKPTQFITIEAGVGYGVSEFDSNVQTGSTYIADRSNFNGITANLAIRHTINSSSSHYVRVSKDRELGLGSNFNDVFSVQYGISYRLMRGIILRSTLVYENFEASGANAEKADRYLLYLGTDYRLARQWTIAIAYAFGLKDSIVPGRDYTQNRVTLDLTRHF